MLSRRDALKTVTAGVIILNGVKPLRGHTTSTIYTPRSGFYKGVVRAECHNQRHDRFFMLDHVYDICQKAEEMEHGEGFEATYVEIRFFTPDYLIDKHKVFLDGQRFHLPPGQMVGGGYHRIGARGEYFGCQPPRKVFAFD